MITWQKWLNIAYIRLKKAGITSAKIDSEILLEQVTNNKREKQLLFSETIINNKQYIKLENLLLRREYGEPIAYITQQQEFWSLKLKISTEIFIPRHDTECLIYKAINLPLPNNSNILDLGTGNGAIALALAKEKPIWKITGIDLSSNAISIARYNAKKLMIKNVNFIQSNWFSKLKNYHYNLIISNPPYIEEDNKYLLNKTMHYEPYISLISGKTGLKDISLIIKNSRKYLLPKAWLLLEHGFEQGEIVRNFFKIYNYKFITTIHDYGLNERITQGQWMPNN